MTRSIEERLAALERSAGRWKAATFGVAALAGTAMMLGAQKKDAAPKDAEAQAEVRAQKFVLVGPDGTDVGVWAGDKNGAGFGMQVGKQRALLAILPGDGPSLDLNGKIQLLCTKSGPGLGLTAGASDIKVVASPKIATLQLKRGATTLSMGAADNEVTLSSQKRGETANAVFRKKE